MNKDIVEELAKNKVVEQIINRILPYKTWSKDLANDVYIILLEKDPELLKRLYEDNQLNFYIVKIIKNNVISNSSQYFQKYINYEKRKSCQIDDLKNI